MLDARVYGFPEGSTLKVYYERTGGIFVCPSCGRFLGFPEWSKNRRQHINMLKVPPPMCLQCIDQRNRPVMARLKYAPKTGKTLVILEEPTDGGYLIYTGVSKLRKGEVYSREAGIRYACDYIQQKRERDSLLVGNLHKQDKETWERLHK